MVGTGILAADGTFTLPLPATVDAGNLLAFNNDKFQPYGIYNAYSQGQVTCAGTPTFSTLTARSISLTLDVAGAGGAKGDIRSRTSSGTTTTSSTAAGTTTHSVVNFKEGALVYMDAPATVKGTITCSGPIVYADSPTPLGTIHGKTVVTLNLVKGWNKVTIPVAQDGTSTETPTSVSADITLDLTVSSAALPSDQWVFMGSPVNLAQLKPAQLKPAQMKKLPSFFFR